jgi:hypothetical protein
MYAVKKGGAIERPPGEAVVSESPGAMQGRESSLRRRLIKLLSAGWLPPSVFTSQGFPRSSRLLKKTADEPLEFVVLA